jgi:hypothetical protein
MLGTDKSQGYCLEMICADFLAGANLENDQFYERAGCFARTKQHYRTSADKLCVQDTEHHHRASDKNPSSRSQKTDAGSPLFGTDKTSLARRRTRGRLLSHSRT